MTRKQVISLALCGAMTLGCLAGCAKKQQPGDMVRSLEGTVATVSASQEDADQIYGFVSATGQLRDILGPQKKLPVTLDITYKLDGNPISPAALAGASGHLEMTYTFHNSETVAVTLDRTTQEYPVPYVMLTGMVLDNSRFENISVTGGKVLDDGTHTAVAAIAVPAVANVLKIDSKYIPASFTLTADVHDFSMMNAYIYGTGELLAKADLSKLDSLDDLNDAADQVKDAMQQLTSGSDALYDGLCTLLLKSQELEKGVNQLADGAAALSDGANALNDGLNVLSSGADQMNSGMQTLSGNSAALCSGATQVFDSLLAAATAQIREKGLNVPALTISNYTSVLNGLIDSLDGTAVSSQATAAAREQVTAAVNARAAEVRAGVTAVVEQSVRAKVEEAIRASITETVRSKTDEIRAGVTAAVQPQVEIQVTAATREQVTAAVLAANGLTPESYQAGIEAGAISPEQQAAIQLAIETQMSSAETQAAIQEAVKAQMATDEVQALITGKVEDQIGVQVAGAFASSDVQAKLEGTVTAQMGSAEVQALIEQNTQQQIRDLIAANMANPEVQQKITEALEAAASGAASISALKTQLDGFASFYYGLNTYTSGVDAAAAAAGQIAAGSHDLAHGGKALSDGADALKQGTLTLKNNIPALLDGIKALRDGSKALSDGIETFDRDAVSKILSELDGDLGSLIPRVKSLQKAAESCSCDKFLIRVDDIGA